MISNTNNKNRQLFVNMVASILTFSVNLGIKFFLTPYVVKSLGPEAYGFIGLSTDIVTYMSLITIALNSMAARFITIEYTSGNIEKANKYFSSVFFSNLVLGCCILFAAVGCVLWLEYIINIPQRFTKDVKLLFSILAINNICGLIFGTWGVATFIKNRLDLSNIRNIIGTVIYSSIIALLFFVYAPHIYFMGIAAACMTAYTITANIQLARRLTPELKISKKNYDFSKVKELLTSGVWNLITRVGEILGQGLDLLIANLFIGATAMGYFALTKNVPFLILALFQTIAGVFAPILTNLYALGKKEELLKELNKSIRVLTMFVSVAVCCFYIFGDKFYSLWIPDEDSTKLQILSIIGTFSIVFTLPLETLWNIFTITNKLKYSTYIMLFNHLMVFTTIIIAMFVVDSLENRLYILAGARSLWGWIRGFWFLPIYGSNCLGYNKFIFYRPILKSILNSLLCFIACLGLRYIYNITSWFDFAVIIISATLLCLIISFVVILTKEDRVFIKNKILRLQ